MKNRKKKGQITAFLGAAALLCAMTGCGDADGDTKGQQEDIIRIENTETDNSQNDESGQLQPELEKSGDENAVPESGRAADDKEGEKTETDQPVQAGVDTTLKEVESDTELEGSVKSVGESSMVVSRIHTYVDEENGGEAAEMAVEYMAGGDELITVYFSENTSFVVRTVKNGGVNGDDDKEDQEGALSDIQENNTVLMTGGYEGEDFHAEQVIIYRFI